MEFSLSAAAKAVGRGKSTIHNAVKTGKLSARREEDGSYKIDASELARVFTLNVPKDGPRDDLEPASEPGGTEVAVLRLKVQMLEDQVGRLDRERETILATVDDLRKQRDEAQAERQNLQRLLMAPEKPAQAPEVDELRRRLEEAEERILSLSKAAPVPAAEKPMEAVAAKATTDRVNQAEEGALVLTAPATASAAKLVQSPEEAPVVSELRKWLGHDKEPAPTEKPLNLGQWRIS